MIELLGDNDPWVASTSGERLLFMLLRNHQEWRVLADSLKDAKLRLGRRYDNLSSFFVGASVLHLQQRLLRLAHDVRDRVPNRWEQAIELRTRACDIIQLTPIEYSGDYGALMEEVLTSAEQMPKEPGPGLKRLVIQNGPKTCYSCGRQFGAIYEDAPDGLKATADHIWPRALGGDTVDENLLPACPPCNSSKGHIAAWQMAWIQPVVFADVDEANGLKSLQREVKMALHIRAAMTYAHQNGSTLRNGLLAIGPREPPVRIDPDQGYDFFNLRVHDHARTNVNWIPN
ncbi:HNH endonuclease [Mesorhizobium sp. M0977]|uniref:HNH endonuclease n=1 Tax=Mesorhizobium sp. M0977 TaxID=2957039 RepID=UPI00333984B0